MTLRSRLAERTDPGWGPALVRGHAGESPGDFGASPSFKGFTGVDSGLVAFGNSLSKGLGNEGLWLSQTQDMGV